MQTFADLRGGGGARGGLAGFPMPTGAGPRLFNLSTNTVQNLGPGARTFGRWWIQQGSCTYDFELQFGNPVAIAGLYGIEMPVPSIGPPAGVGQGSWPVGWIHFQGGIFDIVHTEGHCLPQEATPGFGLAPYQVAIVIPTIIDYPLVGQAVVNPGTTVTTVTHGHHVAPRDVSITPNTNWQTAGMVQWWQDNITATTFDLHATAAGGAVLGGLGAAFTWRANIYNAAFWADNYPYQIDGAGSVNLQSIKGRMVYPAVFG